MPSSHPDAPTEAIANVIRALAPILEYPITKVTKVTKREIFFYEGEAEPVLQDKQKSALTKKGRIVFFSAISRRRANSAKSPKTALMVPPNCRNISLIFAKLKQGAQAVTVQPACAAKAKRANRLTQRNTRANTMRNTR